MKMSLDVLIAAIKSRRAISFEYNKEGKVKGLRIGNPHALYIRRNKDGNESTKVDIVQTSGVSDRTDPFPRWGIFDFSEISNISLMQPEQVFEPFFPTYNPNSDNYKSVIAKI
jgi:hypothetical protein